MAEKRRIQIISFLKKVTYLKVETPLGFVSQESLNESRDNWEIGLNEKHEALNKNNVFIS